MLLLAATSLLATGFLAIDYEGVLLNNKERKALIRLCKKRKRLVVDAYSSSRLSYQLCCCNRKAGAVVAFLREKGIKCRRHKGILPGRDAVVVYDDDLYPTVTGPS